MESYFVASFAGGRDDFQPPGFPIDWHIHEDVERGRNAVFRHAVRAQSFGEVAHAPAMDGLVGVKVPECILTAGCEQEIVPSNAVLDDVQHRP